MWKIAKCFLRKWHRLSYYESLDENRMYGKFYVKYTNGQRSQNFCWKVANEYKNMFGGEMIENF